MGRDRRVEGRWPGDGSGGGEKRGSSFFGSFLISLFETFVKLSATT